MEGYKYIVTAVGFTCKFTKDKSLQEKTAEAVAMFLYETLCRYGSLDIHITEQGNELITFIINDFCHIPGTCHCITSSYHHRLIDLLSARTQMTEDCICKYADEKQNWLEVLDGVLFSIHIAEHLPMN